MTDHKTLPALEEPYGYELQLDLYDCDLAVITDPKALEKFVDQLVDLIGMVKFGNFECPHFGHASPKTSGYSFWQPIETSLVSGHVSDERRALYLNVFSCMYFDYSAVIAFAMQYFTAGWNMVQARTRH